MKPGEEVNNEPQEHRKEQAEPETGQSQIIVRMPPLASYTDRRTQQIGERSRKLTERIIERSSPASMISRIIRLPLISRAYDYLSRKTSSVTPVWLKALELPLVRRRRKDESSPTPGTGFTARRRLTFDAGAGQPLDSDVSSRVSSGAVAEPISGGDEGSYIPTFENTYPMINSNLLPSPETGGEGDKAKRFPGTGLPLLKKKAEGYPDGPERVLPQTGKGKESYLSERAYPAIVDLSFGSTIATERASGKVNESLVDTDSLSVPPQVMPGIGNRGTTGDSRDATGGYSRQEQIHPGQYSQDTERISKEEQIQNISEIARRHQEKKTGRESGQPELPTDGEARVFPDKRFQSISDIARRHREKKAGRESGQPELPTHGEGRISAEKRAIRKSEITEGRQEEASQERHQTDLPTSREGRVSPGKRLQRKSEITEGRQEEASRESGQVNTQRAEEGHVVHEPDIKSEGESEKTIPEQYVESYSPEIAGINKSDEAETRVIDLMNKQAKSTKEENSEYKSLPLDLPVRGKPEILKDTGKKSSLPMIQRTADFINRAITGRLPVKKTGAAGEAPAIMQDRAVPGISRQFDRIQQQEPAVDAYPAPAGENTVTDFSNEDRPLVRQWPDTGDRGPQQSGGAETEASPENKSSLPLSGKPSLMPVPPLRPVHPLGDVRRKESGDAGRNEETSSFIPPIFSDKESGWQYNRQNLPSGPEYQHAPYQMPEMRVDSFVQPKKESGAVYREEPQIDISGRADITPELVHPRIQTALGAGEEQENRAEQEQSQAETATTGTEGREASNEETAEPDVDAIARDVYRVLRRRLIRERERSLGVI